MAFQDQSDVFIHGGHITNLRNLQVLENLEIMESNDDVDITLNDFMSSNIYLRCMSANGHAKWDYLPISQSYLNDKKDQVPSSFAMSNLFSNILDEIDSAIIDNIDSTHSYLNTSLKNKSASSYTVNDLYTYLNNKIENLDTTIDAGEIETSMIGDEQITPRKLSGSIPYTKLLLADGVIPPEKLSTIPYDKLIIENGSIDVKKLTGSIDSNLLPTLSQISGRITENQLPPTIPENRLPEVVLQSKTVTLQSNVDQQLSLIISSGLNNVSTTIVSRVNGIDPFHATTNNVSGQVDISMNEDFLEHLSEDLIELVSGEVEVFVNKYKSEKFTTFIEFESQKNDTEYPTTKSVVKYVSDGFFKKSNISQNISDNDNDVNVPTNAAVIDYVFDNYQIKGTYATESYVTAKGYIDSTYLTANNYAKITDIPSLAGYATESYVTAKGYIDSTYLTANNYAKITDIPSLAGYATESYVTAKGYIDSTYLTTNNYAKIADISSIVSNEIDNYLQDTIIDNENLLNTASTNIQIPSEYGSDATKVPTTEALKNVYNNLNTKISEKSSVSSVNTINHSGFNSDNSDGASVQLVKDVYDNTVRDNKISDDISTDTYIPTNLAVKNHIKNTINSETSIEKINDVDTNYGSDSNVPTTNALKAVYNDLDSKISNKSSVITDVNNVNSLDALDDSTDTTYILSGGASIELVKNVYDTLKNIISESNVTIGNWRFEFGSDDKLKLQKWDGGSWIDKHIFT